MARCFPALAFQPLRKPRQTLTDSLACGASRPEPFDECPPRKRSRKPDPELRSKRDAPFRVEGKGHLGPERDRPRSERPEHGRAAQAGTDLQNPTIAGGEGWSDLR